ncbi:MAG: PilZ domain [Pseudomonadota bacterium]|jgi:DNA-binding response OmpR family regulator
MEQRSVLAFGQFKRDERVSLSVIAQEASLGLHLFDDAKGVANWLEGNAPHVFLIDNAASGAEQVCLEARSRSIQALTPIISLSRELDDLTFAEVFNWGGDDAVGVSAVYPLLSRVRALPREPLAQSRTTRGTAVVADPDRSRRIVRARVLRNAGYDVEFAITASDTMQRASQKTTRLVVLDEDLEDGVTELVHAARKHPATLFLLMCAPRNIAERSTPLEGLTNASVADGFAPPENVVFLANELARGGASDQRTSRRLLYGTTVTFRGEGKSSDDFGYSYNISAGGLYVRTLAPPQDDFVWLELCPPRSDRRVRVEGEVVWRRGFGPAESATVPPGFGVRIVDGTRKNMQAWIDSYSSFCAALGVSERA